jgi:hypothetical protein
VAILGHGLQIGGDGAGQLGRIGQPGIGAAGLAGAQISRFWPERFLLSWSRDAPNG